MPAHKVPIKDTLRRYVSVGGVGSCWVWQGSRDRQGYGKARGRMAHRVAYETWRSPVAKHLTIDHLCRNRACCNPRHMEIVSPVENIRRGGNTQKTHCPKGHPYDEANTILIRGRRNCRACYNVRQRDYMRKKRAEAKASLEDSLSNKGKVF